MIGMRKFALVLAIITAPSFSAAQSLEAAEDLTLFEPEQLKQASGQHFGADGGPAVNINRDIVLSQNLDWLGVNSNPQSVSAVLQSDGSILVTTSSFRVVLSADGQTILRSQPLDAGQELNGMIAPYTIGARPIGLVRYNQDERFLTSDKGTPLPKNGVVDDVLKAQQACLMAADEKLEEARLIELAVSDEGLFAHGEIAAFLQKRGIDPRNLDSEVHRFVQYAHRYRREWEARQDIRWQRLTREDPASNLVEKKGHAEQMGEAIGPYVSGALVGWATGGVLAGASPVVNQLASAGAGAAGVHIVGDFGKSAGGAYGHYIDETGSNPFYPSIYGNSPRPDKSMLDSMREAFGKLLSD